MAPAIFFLRFWMVLVTLVNLSIVITYHAWSVPEMDKIMTKQIRESYENTDINVQVEHYKYTWVDYAIIISSVVLLPAYIYSIWGKKSL
ncbi:hypothetical protein BG015_005773, partial [Linnemannia schmuckeri]